MPAIGICSYQINKAGIDILRKEVSQMSDKLKIVFFSDSHGNPEKMLKAAKIHMSTADYFIFLGDGLGDAKRLEQFTEKPVIKVAGNCDGMYMGITGEKHGSECFLDLGNLSLFICHGHTFGVKSGLGVLEAEAKRKNADIALFGHTHISFQKYIPPEKDGDKPLYLFNPGSISKPRDGAPSYGIIEMSQSVGRKDILLSNATL